VELTRALYPQPGTDIIPLFRDEETFTRIREASCALITDDFQSDFAFPGQTRTYPGLDGLRKNWLDWLEPWATYHVDIDELIDLGERVVVLDRDRGRREDVDEEVELIGATILTFRGGKVARWQFYGNRAEALEAAGLPVD
jgi:ketosteroid isomerase-like protein